jgi:hypothetical protein
MGVSAQFANDPGRPDAWRNIYESLKPGFVGLLSADRRGGDREMMPSQEN